jgi:thiosulfate dehydrogenase [quinone] large subunit
VDDMTTATRFSRTARHTSDGQAQASTPERVGRRSRTADIALTGLRLAIGFEFFWAFLDKLFGFGYATPKAKAWIHGGSPTKGFLSGVTGGPLKGFFHSLAGTAGMDWLFMAGLLGIGGALLLGVALRPAAAAGSLLLIMMWFATWVPDKLADGVPTHSTNPVVDDHIVNAFALVVIATLAGRGIGFLGRRWNALPVVQSQPWLR